MTPTIRLRPRQLLHVAVAATCLAGCQVPPPAAAGGATPTAGPAEASPTPAATSPSPATRTVPPPDAPLLIVTDGVVGKAFRQLDDWAGPFAPGPAPAVQVMDVARLTAKEAEARILEILRDAPDARRVGLVFGAADMLQSRVGVSAFTASLLSIARAVLADGREPQFARIPWSPQPGMLPAPAYNHAIAAVEAAVGLVPGPDLHAWFLAHPDHLSGNGVAPNAAGEAAIRRLWAESLAADAPAPAPTTRPQVTPSATVFVVGGDSITFQNLTAPADWQSHFPDGAAPALRNYGVARETAVGALARFDGILAMNPDAGFVGLAWGTNDAAMGTTAATFEATTRTMVNKVRDAGGVPILARIAWRTRPTLPVIPAFNARLEALEREFRLPPGPDFYTWFKEHPDELSADGLHPSAAGGASMRRLWAEAFSRAVKAGNAP